MKEILTSRDLREMGFSREDIERIAHHHLSYHYLLKTPGGRKFKYRWKELEKRLGEVLR